MKQERAKQLLKAPYGFAALMTADEHKYTLDLWRRLPGWTSLHDAVCIIAAGDPAVRARYGVQDNVRWHGCQATIIDYENDEHGELVYVLRLENGNPAWASEEELTQ